MNEKKRDEAVKALEEFTKQHGVIPRAEENEKEELLGLRIQQNRLINQVNYWSKTQAQRDEEKAEIERRILADRALGLSF